MSVRVRVQGQARLGVRFALPCNKPPAGPLGMLQDPTGFLSPPLDETVSALAAPIAQRLRSCCLLRTVANVFENAFPCNGLQCLT
jgi:hypothetical protein